MATKASSKQTKAEGNQTPRLPSWLPRFPAVWLWASFRNSLSGALASSPQKQSLEPQQSPAQGLRETEGTEGRQRAQRSSGTSASRRVFSRKFFLKASRRQPSAHRKANVTGRPLIEVEKGPPQVWGSHSNNDHWGLPKGAPAPVPSALWALPSARLPLILQMRKLRPREVKKLTRGTQLLHTCIVASMSHSVLAQGTFPQSVSLAVTLGTKPFSTGCEARMKPQAQSISG